MKKTIPFVIALLCIAAMISMAVTVNFDRNNTKCVVTDIDNESGKCGIQVEERDGGSYKQFIGIVPMEFVYDYDSTDGTAYIANEAFDSDSVYIEYTHTTFKSRWE